jgi:hypothetical protein
MSSKSISIVRRIYEALGRGDVPAVLDTLDAEIEWREPETRQLPFAGVHRGKSAVADEVFATVPVTWDEFRLETDEFLDAGSAVVVIGEFRGRATGGRSLRAPFAHVWKLREEKAVTFSNYTDTAAFLEALQGVREAAAAERAVALGIRI